MDILHQEYGVISVSKDLIVDVSGDRTKIYELMKLGIKKESIVTSHPFLAEEWHPELNGFLKPEMFTKGSEKIVWWRCLKCGHSYEKSVYGHIRNGRCPVCHYRKV